MTDPKQIVTRKLREYWNEAQEIEEEFEEDPFNIIQKENALIQLDEKYAELIVKRLGL